MARLMLTEKQRGVLKGMMCGLAASVLALALSIVVAPDIFIPHQSDPQSMLSHALRWDILLVIWLAACIAMLARHRFFNPLDIDGGGLSDNSSSVRVLQSVLQNTLEQVVLAVSVHVIWAVSMPLRWQAAIPAAAILFALGRALFWRGYAHGAPARALGFALTFYPTMLMLIIIGVNLVFTAVSG